MPSERPSSGFGDREVPSFAEEPALVPFLEEKEKPPPVGGGFSDRPHLCATNSGGGPGYSHWKQLGQAFGPCPSSTRSATAICVVAEYGKGPEPLKGPPP